MLDLTSSDSDGSESMSDSSTSILISKRRGASRYYKKESSESKSFESATKHQHKHSLIKLKKDPTSNICHLGIDPSMGKDNELFGVSIKNMDTLENELSPEYLGKHLPLVVGKN